MKTDLMKLSTELQNLSDFLYNECAGNSEKALERRYKHKIRVLKIRVGHLRYNLGLSKSGKK